MPTSLRIGLLGVGIFLIIIVLIILRKGRMPTKYAIVWLIPSIVIILLVMVPDLFLFFSKALGFQTISNLIVGLLFVLLFFIIMSLTVIVAGQTTKINLLIQEISLLKEKIKNQ